MFLSLPAWLEHQVQDLQVLDLDLQVLDLVLQVLDQDLQVLDLVLAVTFSSHQRHIFTAQRFYF